MKIKYIVITLFLLIVVISSYMYSELLLVLLLLIKNTIIKFLIGMKGFVFKDGIIALSNVYWKKVLSASSLALLKRVFINSINAFFTEYVINPIIVPSTKYLKMQWGKFKSYTIWKKVYSAVIGVIPLTILLWIVGVVDVILLLSKSLSLAKFLTAILKVITGLLFIVKKSWNTLIQPYIDVIIATILINYIEKIPFFGRKFRWVRINIRLIFRRVGRSKKKVVDKHVIDRVAIVVKKIEDKVENGSK